jgi:DNA-binding SARP family transcriptional activator
LTPGEKEGTEMAVSVRLLGGFGVDLNGVPIASESWSRRHAASLVKLLALATGRRMHRERVIEALWPGLSVDTALPRLHKAAHYARRTLGGDGSVVLRHDTVALLPEIEVVIDAEVFRRAGQAAIATGAPGAAQDALDVHGGVLLPDDLYEPWAEEARDALRLLHQDLLRLAGRWQDLLHEDPTNEEAHLVLVRASADRGDISGALRQFERMDQTLRRDLGTSPSAEAQQLRAQLEARAPATRAGKKAPVTRVFGRREVGDQIRERLDGAEAGQGGIMVFHGPPGVGKSTVLDLAEALARKRGWRTGRATASALEGPWPYAPVLEALSDLCSHHKAVCDGLPEAYQKDLARAVSGRDVSWSGESAHPRLFVAAAELVRLASTDRGLLLVVDDLHETDDASMRLLHYLSRRAVSARVLIVLAHRPTTRASVREVLDSLVARAVGPRIGLSPLTESTTRRLLAERFPDLSSEAVAHIWRVSAGLPFIALEMAREQTSGAGPAVHHLPGPARRTFERVALLGATFTTDEFLAVSGTTEDHAYQHLEMGLGAFVIEPTDSGYRFRHALVREALLEQMPVILKAVAHREITERLAELGVPPGRVVHQYLAAGLPSRAVPFVLRAVETAGSLGAHRDALALVDLVREHRAVDLPRPLARRPDVLAGWSGR